MHVDTASSVLDESGFAEPAVSTDAFDEFEQSHAEWVAKLNIVEPVYCLPEAAIDCLAARDANHPPLLDDKAACAERDFHNLCWYAGAAGFWHKVPIYFPCLNDSAYVPRDRLVELGYELPKRCFYTRGFNGTIRWERLKGYVGRLLIDPDFTRHREALRDTWNNIAESDRPRFPLRVDIVVEGGPLRIWTSEVVAFKRAVNEFLRRWDIVLMVTWDLPLPSTPAFTSENVLFLGRALPERAVHLVVPVHYPLTNGDPLLDEIRRQQEQLAEKARLPQDVAGLPRYEILGQMFQVDHLERTIRSRCVHAKRKGDIGHMEAAISTALSIGVDHVKKLRKGINASRRGRLASLKWLSASDEDASTS